MAGGWYKEDLEGMSLKQGLTIHLTVRIFPPQLIMFKAARKAIKACQKGEYAKLIPLPKDVIFKGSNKAPARDIINHLKLEDFLYKRDK